MRPDNAGKRPKKSSSGEDASGGGGDGGSSGGGGVGIEGGREDGEDEGEEEDKSNSSEEALRTPLADTNLPTPQSFSLLASFLKDYESFVEVKVETLEGVFIG